MPPSQTLASPVTLEVTDRHHSEGVTTAVPMGFQEGTQKSHSFRGDSEGMLVPKFCRESGREL